MYNNHFLDDLDEFFMLVKNVSEKQIINILLLKTIIILKSLPKRHTAELICLKEFIVCFGSY